MRAGTCGHQKTGPRKPGEGGEDKSVVGSGTASVGSGLGTLKIVAGRKKVNG